MSVIYFYDGTREGFYTAVFDAWKEKNAVLARGSVQTGLNDTIVTVTASEEKARRVLVGIRRVDAAAAEETDDMLRSDLPFAPDTAFRYIRVLMRYGAPVRARLAEEDVFAAVDLVRKVRAEIHRFKGFLRFSETSGGVLYAPYSPDNDITERLMPHFIARFRGERFVIHDIKREIAGLYNGNDALLTRLPKGEIALSQDEEAFAGLWQNYYRSVNIVERKNLRQMRGYMPVRYWKFMPEKKP